MNEQKQNVFHLPPSAVSVEGRVRKDFDEKAHLRLCESIRNVGQINPILLEKGTNRLVAGERRLRACTALECDVLCLYREDADPALLLEIELEENLARADLTPQEIAEGRAKLYEMKLSRSGGVSGALARGSGLSLEKAAEEMGVTKGSLSADLKIAQWLKVVPELTECKTRAEILSKIKGMEKQVSWLLETEAALSSVAASTAAPERGEPRAYLELTPGTPEWSAHWSAFPEMQEEMLRFKKAFREGGEFIPPAELPPPAPEKKVLSAQELRLIALEQKLSLWNARLIEGDCRPFLAGERRFPSPNLIFWDPPYGISHDEKLEGMVDGGEYETFNDSPDHFRSFFAELARSLYGMAATDAHLYCFFGIVHFDLVYHSLEEAGWTVNRRPIIWVKENIRSTRVPTIWPGASYEAIAFARKGSRDLVKKKGDIIIGKATPPSEKGHPNEKPVYLYTDLLERSAYPGDWLFDPMYGSGSVFRAAEQFIGLNLNWYGCEEKKQFRDLALFKLLKMMKGEE